MIMRCIIVVLLGGVSMVLHYTTVCIIKILDLEYSIRYSGVLYSIGSYILYFFLYLFYNCKEISQS